MGIKFNPLSGTFDIDTKLSITVLDGRYLQLTGSLANVTDHSHTVLTDIGTNTHAQIDSHVGSTSNPHSVTLAQVGGTTDHTALSNIGTNTHSQIDTFIGTTVPNTYLKLTGGTITPLSDSTSVLNVTKADATTIFNIDSTNNRVGIGTVTPTVHFELASNATQYFHISTATTGGTAGGNMKYETSRGTLAVPTTLAADDLLGKFSFSGYDGATFKSHATIEALVDGTVAVGTMPTRLVFSTATTTARVERMRIDKNGNVGIGTTNPLTALHIESATDATITSRKTGTAATGVIFGDNGAGYLNIKPSATAYGIVVRNSADDASYFSFNAYSTYALFKYKENTGLIFGSDGNIGVGADASPDYKLDVQGTFRADLDSSFGASLGVGVTAVAGNRLYVSAAVGDTSSYNAATTDITVTTTTNTAFAFNAMNFTANKIGAYNIANLRGVIGSVYHSGTGGTTGALQAIYTNVGLLGAASAGSISNAYHIVISQISRAAGSTTTVGSAFGINISNQGAAYVGSTYGIYIHAQSGAVTNNYSIYSNGGTMYHGGSVGIGTVPSAKLHVVDTATADSTYGVLAGVTVSTAYNSCAAFRFAPIASHTTGTVSFLYGFNGTATNLATGTGVVTNLYGGLVSAAHRSANAASLLVGIECGYNQYASMGAVTTGVSFNASGNVGTGSTMTNAYMFRGVAVTGGGTITNQYGLYLPDINLGGTKNFAIQTNAGNIVFNEGGDSLTDFRVESDAYDAIFVDASNDSVAVMNNASGKISFFGVTPVTRPTELTDELTTLTFTAPGTPDYAIADLIDSSAGATFGFATKDEGNSVLAVIANLQARVNELETKLVSVGLILDAD